jgi:hypothetical protein
MGRIAQISKVISEGGYDKIFQQTFECSPDEKLNKAYVCYLSTSHGPIMGVLYLSTVKIAFGSDSPVKYVTEDNKTESSFYKVRGGCVSCPPPLRCVQWSSLGLGPWV